MRQEDVIIPVGIGEKTSGILCIPDTCIAEDGIIFGHGAGNDMNHPLIVFLAEALANRGYLTMRFNFPYREQGKKSPDSDEKLCAAWEGAYRFVADHPDYRPEHVIAAGKSLGGRIASQMAASGRLNVQGLIFLGYPLHAPGRKDRPRDSHLFKVPAPMLFFAGTRDPLCDLEVLEKTLSQVIVPWELETIEGADHSFDLPKSYGTDQREVYERIFQKILKWQA